MSRRLVQAILVSGVVLGVLGAASARALAHHSAAMFDEKKTITVEGEVKEFQLTNPHSWFFLDVKDANGKIDRWAFEAGTPSGMIRNGYKATDLPTGTMVTIKGFHAKDPSQNAGMLDQLITASGKTYTRFGPQEGPER